MKVLKPLLLIPLITIACNFSDKKTNKHFRELNWSISIPNNFEIVDTEEIETLNEIGKSNFENTLDTTLDFSATKNLITIKKGDLNYLTATVRPFDSKTNDHTLFSNAEKISLVQGLQAQVPSIIIDSSSSLQVLDGGSFDKFSLKLTYPDNRIYNIILYNEIYKNLDFSVTVSYADASIGKQLDEIFLKSKFH